MTVKEETKNTSAASDPVKDRKMSEAANLAGMALQLQGQKRYNEAYDNFNKARAIYEQIGEKEGMAIQLRHMGYIRENLGDSAAAIKLYEEGRKYFEELKNPAEFSDLTDRIAKCYYRDGKSKEALNEYVRAAEFGSESEDIYNNLGFIQIEFGEFGQAEKNLLKAKELKEKENQVATDITLNNLGIISYLKKDYAKADEYFSQALKATPAVVKYERTIQYIVFCNEGYRKNDSDAYEWCDDVITSACVHLNKAAACMMLGKKDEALMNCRAAHGIDPNMTYLHLPSAWIYLTAGDKERAIAYFKKALAANPEKESYLKEIIESLNPYAFMKVERNESCPCGSGKKYKKCHGRDL